MRRAGLLMALLAVTATTHAEPSARESVARIEQAAHDFAVRQARSYGGDPQVEITPLDPRLRLARCSQSLQITLAPGAKPVGHTSIGVRCPGPTPWSLYVQAEVRILAEVLVAARPLARGVPLRAEDLTRQTQDLGALATGALTDPNRVVGQRLRYPVAAGAVLNAGLFERNPRVRRGQIVTVISGHGSLEVRASGEALSDAASGETLRVRNALTKKVIEGRVDDQGIVRVAL